MDSKSRKNRENLVRQFNYCNAIAEDIIRHKHNRLSDVQEYAKNFAEIENCFVEEGHKGYIRINWGSIYIFLYDDEEICYLVDPFWGCCGNLIEVMGNLKNKAMLDEKFIQEILSLETLPIVRNGISFYDVNRIAPTPPFDYKPMRDGYNGEEYVIKYRGKRLDGFYSNDIPEITSNDNVSVKHIISFSNNHYKVFSSFKEAKNCIVYMLREVNDKENYIRYNEVHPFAKEKLIKIIEEMEICKQQSKTI